MSSLQTRDIRANLTKKGFTEDSSGDHIWLNYRLPDGRKTVIRTKVSHGKPSIGDDLISKMSRQVHLSKKDFMKLVNCTLSADEYYDTIQEIL